MLDTSVLIDRYPLAIVHAASRAAASIFTIDPRTWEITTFSDKVNMAFDRLGKHYCSKRGDRYRWIP